MFSTFAAQQRDGQTDCCASDDGASLRGAAVVRLILAVLVGLEEYDPDKYLWVLRCAAAEPQELAWWISRASAVDHELAARDAAPIEPLLQWLDAELRDAAPLISFPAQESPCRSVRFVDFEPVATLGSSDSRSW